MSCMLPLVFQLFKSTTRTQDPEKMLVIFKVKLPFEWATFNWPSHIRMTTCKLDAYNPLPVGCLFQVVPHRINKESALTYHRRQVSASCSPGGHWSLETTALPVAATCAEHFLNCGELLSKQQTTYQFLRNRTPGWKSNLLHRISCVLYSILESVVLYV